MTNEAQVGWAPGRVIELEKLIPFDASLNWDTHLIGFAEGGVGAIFMHVGDEVFNVDLKSGKVMKVYQGRICYVIPYMSFRTPGTDLFRHYGNLSFSSKTQAY
jgi:hypothetical protein